MKSSLKFGKRLFLNNIIFNIIVIILYAIVNIVLGYVIISIKNINKTLEVFDGLDTNKGAYYFHLNNTEDITSQLVKVKNYNVEGGFTVTYNNKNISVHHYSYDFVSKVKLPLISGEWFTDAENKEGIINAVVTADSGLKDGDTVSVTTYLGEFTFHITGILPNNTKIISFSGWNTDVGFNKILDSRRQDVVAFSGPLLFCDNEKINSSIPSTDITNAFVLFEEDITKTEYEYNLKVLENNCYGVISLEQLINESKQEKAQFLNFFMPIIIIIFLIATISFACATIINLKRSYKIIALNYIVGGSYVNHIGILSVFYSIVYLISLAVYGICAFYMGRFFASIGTFANIPLILCLIPLIFLFVIFVFIFVSSIKITKTPLSGYLNKK